MKSGKKFKLLEDFPYCHWCKRRVYVFRAEKGKQTPPSAATRDHYYAKGDKRREKNNYPVVLSCYRCNNKRGDMKPEKWENKLDINRDKRAEIYTGNPLTSKIYELIDPEIKLKLNKI